MTKKKPGKTRGGPGRLTAEDAARVEDRLLDAALALFNEKSFADTTMDQIARRAGASTKTLYSRYADKVAVMEAVVNRIIERSLAATAAIAPLDPRLTDPRTFIVNFGINIVTGIGTEGAGLIRIALGEAQRFPAINEKYNATLARGRGLFQHALEEWHAQGLLPELKNPPMAAMLLVSLLSDMARIRVAMGQPMTGAEIKAYITYAADLFLRGLGYKPNKA